MMIEPVLGEGFLKSFFSGLPWWWYVALVALVGLLVFFFWYRKKQV